MSEVFVETGYRAEIIGVLPGVFAGSTAINAYFVMRPLGVPGTPDWETQSIRWADFGDAVLRIEKTVNAKGRKRDLDVLAASRSWFDSNRSLLVVDEDGIVTAGNWDKRIGMPKFGR